MIYISGLEPIGLPWEVSALCCLVGVSLFVISILSIIGVARLGNDKTWTARDSLQMFYQCIFGLAAGHMYSLKGLGTQIRMRSLCSST